MHFDWKLRGDEEHFFRMTRTTVWQKVSHVENAVQSCCIEIATKKIDPNADVGQLVNKYMQHYDTIVPTLGAYEVNVEQEYRQIRNDFGEAQKVLSKYISIDITFEGDDAYFIVAPSSAVSDCPKGVLSGNTIHLEVWLSDRQDRTSVAKEVYDHIASILDGLRKDVGSLHDRMANEVRKAIEQRLKFQSEA